MGSKFIFPTHLSILKGTLFEPLNCRDCCPGKDTWRWSFKIHPMSNLYIPSEDDFRKWIKDAIRECLVEALADKIPPTSPKDEELLCRKQIAAILGISLVTLHKWMNRGLPCHKQRGRVYFIRSEVMDYVKANRRDSLPHQAAA
jgi:Helix-turn-helix domain